MKFTRRDFLKVAGVGGAGLLLATWAGTRPTAANTIRILALPRSIVPATIAAFTDSSGVTIQLDIAPDGNYILEHFRFYDLAAIPAHKLSTLIRRDLVRELNPMPLPPMEQRAYDPLNAFSLPAARGAIGINSRGVYLPQSWAEFFALAPTVPAHLPPTETFNAALKSLGHSINTRDAAARLQARALVSSIPSVVLTDARLTIGSHLSSWDFTLPVEGAELWEDCYCIPVDSPHSDSAHHFIHFALANQPLTPLPDRPLELPSPFTPREFP